ISKAQVSDAGQASSSTVEKSLEETMPDVYAQLVEVYKKLESHYRDMQDIEFTIQSGKLYLLQTRTGKRTGFAAVKIACDMVDEGLINQREAVERVEAGQIVQLLAPVFDVKEKESATKGTSRSRKATGSPSTARPARSSAASCRRSRPRSSRSSSRTR